MEAVITAGLAHPHVVRTVAHATTPGPVRHTRCKLRPKPGEPLMPEGEESETEEVWLLLEYCDQGCLQVRYLGTCLDVRKGKNCWYIACLVCLLYAVSYAL